MGAVVCYNAVSNLTIGYIISGSETRSTFLDVALIKQFEIYPDPMLVFIMIM